MIVLDNYWVKLAKNWIQKHSLEVQKLDLFGVNKNFAWGF